MRSLIPRRPHVCRQAIVVVAWVAATAHAARDPGSPDLSESWRLGAQSRFREAEAALPKTNGPPDHATANEERDFAAAVLLLTRQPRSTAAIDHATLLLAQLAAAAASADLRARARYFQARAIDLYQSSAATDTAAGLYRALRREHPSHSLGQRALIHLLMLAFYANEPSDAVLAHVTEIEKEAATLTDPVVLSQFHQVAARGLLHLGGENARALDHLLALNQLGVLRNEARSDLHVSIGELATELGRHDVARRAYDAFLREFPHDTRAFTVRARLAALSP